MTHDELSIQRLGKKDALVPHLKLFLALRSPLCAGHLSVMLCDPPGTSLAPEDDVD